MFSGLCMWVSRLHTVYSGAQAFAQAPCQQGECMETDVLNQNQSTTNTSKEDMPMNIMKRQKDMTLKDQFPRSVGAQHVMGEE